MPFPLPTQPSTHLKQPRLIQTTAALSQPRDIPSKQEPDPMGSHKDQAEPGKATCSTWAGHPLAPGTGAADILVKSTVFPVCPFPKSHGITESARLEEIFKVFLSHYHPSTTITPKPCPPSRQLLKASRGGDSPTSHCSPQLPTLACHPLTCTLRSSPCSPLC